MSDYRLRPLGLRLEFRLGPCSRRSAARLLALLLAALSTGCVLEPEGLKPEADRAAAAGEPYRSPFEQRQLPELPPAPSWDDFVQRALQANGDVEAAWHEWSAAIERVSVAAGWPNTNLAVEYSVAIGGGSTLWERSTFGLGFDPMEMLALPDKTRAAGRVALEEARAAGRRFDAARLAVRRRTIEALAERSVWTEQHAVASELVELLALAETSARVGVEVGAPQQGLLQAAVERSRALGELADLEAQGPRSAAMLNALLARAPHAALPAIAFEAPARLPDDATLLALGASDNPGLGERAALVAARREALGVAQQGELPDVAPVGSASGGADEEVGLMFSIPVTLPSVRAAIAAARADLAAAQAASRQAGSDAEAAFVATLSALRAAERQAALLEATVGPAATQLIHNGDEAYVSGAAGIEALIEGRRAALEARIALSEARAAREVRLAELAELAGRELELSAQGDSP